MLFELGRYPVFIPALRHCLKYEYHINSTDRSSLISITMSEMKNNPDIDCWMTRVERIKSLFDIRRLSCNPDRAGVIIDRNIKSKFDRFFLDQINQTKIGIDGQDHNKMRFYKQFKGSFKIEPYIVEILNKNQRQWLSRYRTSAHNLQIELGRYTRPVTPILERKCKYCKNYLLPSSVPVKSLVELR